MKTVEEMRKEFEKTETARKLMPFCKWRGGEYVNVFNDVDFEDHVNSMNFMFELFQELNK